MSEDSSISQRPVQIIFRKKGWDNANAAMDSLFGLFEDHYPYVVSEDDESWVFGLTWPLDPLWYVDPFVSDQARRLFGFSLAELPTLCEISDCGGIPLLFTMFHSRALLVQALAANRTKTFTHIIHIDDHNDLMPCLVVPAGAVLRDSVHGACIDVDDLDSVRNAIERGIVTKGNFLTAYLLAKTPGQLIYVNRNLPRATFWLGFRQNEVVLSQRRILQTQVTFHEDPIEGAWKLEEKPELPIRLQVSASDGVWLDIDLDGFNNRYNGDSHRKDLLGSAEEQRNLEASIDQFLEELAQATWKSQIGGVSVAASPSFFPSEYWEWTIPKIREGIERIICSHVESRRSGDPLSE